MLPKTAALYIVLVAIQINENQKISSKIIIRINLSLDGCIMFILIIQQYSTEEIQTQRSGTASAFCRSFIWSSEAALCS
jgi:hypothetical protein